MRKFTAGLGILLSSSLVLAACSSETGDADESGTGGTDATGADATEARDAVPEVDGNPDATVSIGFLLEPTGLDPTTVSGAALDQLVTDNVYEGLTFRDQNGEITPKLAKEWDISEDGLIYTFHLEEGVTFHDGSDFTAEDVIATLEASSAEDSLNPDSKLMATFESARAVDDYTVEVKLSEPNMNFLDTMATDAAAMVPSDNTVDLNTESNGTGPYRIGEWQTGSSITLERNDDYWGEPAANAEVVFRYYQDQSAAANGLASGEIDILTTYNTDTISRFESDPSIVMTEGNQTSWMTLGFNHDNEVLSDVRVRQAIRMGIDKDGLITSLGGNMDRTGSMTAPGQAWWDESLIDIQAYDPEAARALLAEAGYEDGLELNLRVANNYDTAISEYIQAQLAEIGITVNIETMEFATWLEEVYQGSDYDMTMVLHVDPWTLTYYANAEYYWNYDNPEAAALLDEALAAPDFAGRDEKLVELARLISEDAASDWLYVPQSLTFATDQVSGYPVSRTGSRYPVYTISKAD